jgi:hypothetical protein
LSWLPVAFAVPVVLSFERVTLAEPFVVALSLLPGATFASVVTLWDEVLAFASAPMVELGWAKTVTGRTARPVANKPVVAIVKIRFIVLLLCTGEISMLRLQAEQHSIVSGRRCLCGRTKANDADRD